MSSVLTDVPRVVHPDDVYSGEVHVAGRNFHYVCGMFCHETVSKRTKTGKEQEGSFRLQRLMREDGGLQRKDGFCMYAEERLGKNINSAGIMWEVGSDRRVVPWNKKCNEWKWKSKVRKFQIDMDFRTAAVLGGKVWP
jgi:hypothetical protein